MVGEWILPCGRGCRHRCPDSESTANKIFQRATRHVLDRLAIKRERSHQSGREDLDAVGRNESKPSAIFNALDPVNEESKVGLLCHVGDGPVVLEISTSLTSHWFRLGNGFAIEFTGTGRRPPHPGYDADQ